VRISWGRGVRREKLGWGLVEGEVRGEGAELFRHGWFTPIFRNRARRGVDDRRKSAVWDASWNNGLGIFRGRLLRGLHLKIRLAKRSWNQMFCLIRAGLLGRG
jgi:hypothetical protein